jgi:glycosyltransferase involved in cell wall biosynthesis
MNDFSRTSTGLDSTLQRVCGLFDQLDDAPADDAALVSCNAAVEARAERLLAEAEHRVWRTESDAYPVSALVSAYESGDFLGEALEDIAAQSLDAPVEIVIIDAHSPHREREIAASFAERYPHIRYVRMAERIGIYDAWNAAIHYSRGTFLSPLSVNDRLNPDAYRLCADFLASNPEVDLAYGDTLLTDKPHQAFGSHTPSRYFNGAWRWPAFDRRDLLGNCRIGPHPMWRRSLHRTAGYFDPRYRATGDQDFWLRACRNHSFAHIGVATGLAWLTPDSLSGYNQTSHAEALSIHARHQNIYLSEVHSAILGGACGPRQVKAELRRRADLMRSGPHARLFDPRAPIYVRPFADAVSELANEGRWRESIACYDLLRPLFPDYDGLVQFDALAARLRDKANSEAVPPRDRQRENS